MKAERPRLTVTMAVMALLLGGPPLAAQTAPPAETEGEAEGFDLMEEGARLLLRGLMREMEPAISDMGKALSEAEPALRELLALIDDLRNYDTPRMLDNGDILIPRRKEAPALPPSDGNEIEL